MIGPDGDKLCATCGEPNPVRAKFCLECGNKFETADELGERRVLTVLFADIAGFTAFSEGSDVEDVHALAQEAADRLSEIVDRYGGTVDKIIGDCVMAVWGAPDTHEDDAERAVRAALDMQAVVASRSERFFGLSLSTGLYTGEAIWAPIGPDGRYTALGDTVNTAARLQGAAGKGEIYVGTDTYHATSDVIEYADVEPVKAKNKAEPVLAWNAVGVKGVRRRAVELPMVGRQAEMGRLWELWELVRTERIPYLAALTGGPGIGKSRLVRAVTTRLEESASVLWGRCLDYGEGITYWPVIEMVKGAAGIQHDDTSEETSRKLGELLEALGSEDLDELRTMAVAMANLVAAPTTPRGTYSATEITKGELHWGIRRVFQLLAHTRPVTLVFEDLHWAEPALVDLVTSFTEMQDNAPILVIGSARPQLDPQVFEGRKNTRRIELDALDEADSRALVAHMLGSEEAAEGPMAKLLESAAGNPLFLEEMVRMLLDAGALDDEGRLIPEKVASLTMPSSVRALIGTRLDNSLSGTQKRTAGRASVVGEAFWSGAVAYLDGNGTTDDAVVYELEVDRMLGELEDKDVVLGRETTTITGQREWNFRHALIRDVVYQRIPKTQRVRLHARCGAWMAGLPGGSDELIEIVAYHLEQSCVLAREVARSSHAPPVIEAVRALTRASEKAEAREGIREGERFLARALALLDGAFPETSTELKHRRARMLSFLGEYEPAYAAMSEVAREAAGVGLLDLQCRALISMAEIDLIFGRVDEGRSNLETATKLAQQSDDLSLRVRIGWQSAILHQSEPRTAENDLRAAIALANEIDAAELMLTGRMRLGALFFNTGRLTDAADEFQSCAELAQAQGSLRHLSWVTAMLGFVRLHIGPRSAAEGDLARACEWLERTEDKYMLAQALLWSAQAKLAEDDFRMATLLLRRAAAAARELGGPIRISVACTLVEALARQDRVGEAREILAEVESSESAEDSNSQAGIHLAKAFIAAAEDDQETSRQEFDAAAALVEAAGDGSDYGEVLYLQGRAVAEFGDTAAATEMLEKAYANFEKVGATAKMDDVQRVLERIAPPAQVLKFGRSG